MIRQGTGDGQAAGGNVSGDGSGTPVDLSRDPWAAGVEAVLFPRPVGDRLEERAERLRSQLRLVQHELIGIQYHVDSEWMGDEWGRMEDARRMFKLLAGMLEDLTRAVAEREVRARAEREAWQRHLAQIKRGEVAA